VLAVYTTSDQRLGYFTALGGSPGFVTDGNAFGIPDGFLFKGASTTVYFSGANCTGSAYVTPATRVLSNEIYWADVSMASGQFYAWGGASMTSVATASYATGAACVNSGLASTPYYPVYLVGGFGIRNSYPWTVKVE
jgi:hypothetical protein